jgi:hypothetical protein
VRPKMKPVPVFSEEDIQAAQDHATECARLMATYEAERDVERKRAGVLAEAVRELTARLGGDLCDRALLPGEAERYQRLLADVPQTHELVPLGTQDALVDLVEAIDGGSVPSATADMRAAGLRAALAQARPLVEGVERTPTPELSRDELIAHVAYTLGPLHVIHPGVAEPEPVDPKALVGHVLYHAGDQWRRMAFPCSRCEGHGTVGVTQRGEDPTECPACGGSGAWDAPDGSSYTECPKCDGVGTPTPSGITDAMVDAAREEMSEAWAALLCGPSWQRKMVRRALTAALQAGSSEGHTLVPTRSMPIASHFAHQEADRLDQRDGPGAGDEAGRWAHAFREAARGGRPQWPELEGASS